MLGNQEAKLSDSEKAILKALQFTPKLMLRWGKIKKKTGLSTRTLSIRLKDLQEKGLVKRVVDAKAKEYPPPVYYQLIGEIERKSATLVEREWRQISKKINRLFKVTQNDPEAFLGSVIEAIMVDVIFTLYYASTTPRVIGSVLLTKWHNDVHQKLMWDTVQRCAKSKEYQGLLKQIYENARKDIAADPSSS